MPGKCLRGAVIEINLDPTVGHQQAKKRPCVVVQNDISNSHSYTTIVAPITGAEHIRKRSPVHAFVHAGEGGLTKDSVVLCDQIRAVDERRFLDTLGFMTDSTMKAIDQALVVALGLYDKWRPVP